MDLSSPISSVIPTVHGRILAVLAGTTQPMTGRQVSGLVGGSHSQPHVNGALGQLADAGLLLRESVPPAKLYRLNREHVAAPAIEALSSLWTTLVARIREELASWEVPADGAWLFGSAARGEGGLHSDVDLLLVKANRLKPTLTSRWDEQTHDLARRVQSWSGNSCEVLELTRTDLRSAVDRGDRLVADLRHHGLPLMDQPASLLRKPTR